MKKILCLCAMLFAAVFLASCEVTYGEDSADATVAEEDATIDADESPPEEDVVDDYLPEIPCTTPWPDGTAVSCKDGDFVVDYCELSWDKESCTASCWDPFYHSDAFWGAKPEAVSDFCHLFPAN